MQKRLSIAVMTHNEVVEFAWLMDELSKLDPNAAEVVVVDDHSNPPMQELFSRYALTLSHRSLDGDFASQRNHLNALCRGDYILVLDPDEMPSRGLLGNLFRLCATMDATGILACALPRLNILHDGTEPVDARTLALTDDDFADLDPDYQVRLYRNIPSIRWENKVHEKLVGMDRAYRLPDTIDHALLHVKARKRQVDQNAFYDTVAPYSLRHIAKRLGLRPLAAAFGLLKEPTWLPLRLD